METTVSALLRWDALAQSRPGNDSLSSAYLCWSGRILDFLPPVLSWCTPSSPFSTKLFASHHCRDASYIARRYGLWPVHRSLWAPLSWPFTSPFPCTAPRSCTTGVYLLLNWPLPGVELRLPWKAVTANCYHRDNEVCLFSEASFKTLTVLFNLCSPALILYTNATPVFTFVNKSVIMFLPFLFACHAEGSLVKCRATHNTISFHTSKSGPINF